MNNRPVFGHSSETQSYPIDMIIIKIDFELILTDKELINKFKKLKANYGLHGIWAYEPTTCNLFLNIFKP
jgi:hypothetical protein